MAAEDLVLGDGVAVWNSVLGAALKIPGARIDRSAFLQSSLGKLVSPEMVAEAIASSPATAGVPASVVRRAAQSSLRWHRAGVTASSAAVGLPGGWWIAGTIPTDLAQYFWHVIVVLQKLAYLHGWPELVRKGEELDDETKMVLTLFIGVMMGAQGAAKGLSQLSKLLAQQVARRVPRAPLTKYAVYNLAKHVARWLGASLTKKQAGQLLGRAVPIVGGVVSGALTWVLFGTGGKRLLAHLESLELARP